MALRSGSVLLVDPDVGVLATLSASGNGSVLAMLTSGHVDPLGTTPETLFCRYGTALAPLDVCGERWIAEGALAELLAGSRRYELP